MKELNGLDLNLADIESIIFSNVPISISSYKTKMLRDSYRLLKTIAQKNQPVYGINTGFGALAEIKINTKDQKILQKNIILSHAVGVGPPLDFFVAKTLVLLRINTLIKGYSGASPQLIESLICLFNANCSPFIPKKGSVGASGDLAPLAHLGLLLLGQGHALLLGDQVISASEALHKAKISPLKLGIRDGLALINGTQAMTAAGIIAIINCRNLANLADLAAAITLDALGGHKIPFDERIHQIKPHPGQIKTAQNICKAIHGRTIEDLKINKLTQDPYSLRCIPQVHGATKDVISHVQETILREINSVTDNPLFFTSVKDSSIDILSGGNFHGQHVALALDYLSMGISELANISERRLELLLNPIHSNGLPAFLIPNSGLNSGYMMLHVTATALINENKILCHPASTDSIPTSANREDHVSMGMNSANKLLEVITNTKIVLTIELLAALQALDFRKLKHTGIGIKKFHSRFRKLVPFRKQDGLYKDDLEKAIIWLNSIEAQKLIKEIVVS
jgi:histidine ammonia-lyase